MIGPLPKRVLELHKYPTVSHLLSILFPSIYHHIFGTFFRPPSISIILPSNSHRSPISFVSTYYLSVHHRLTIGPPSIHHRFTIILPSSLSPALHTLRSSLLVIIDLHQAAISVSTSRNEFPAHLSIAAMEIERRSRYKPLKTEEAWDRLVATSEILKVLERLSDVEAQRSSEAVETLNMVEPSGKLKRYKETLCDVLCSGPQFVLLCAVALGQVRLTNMKNDDRVGLISKIKANKDNADFNHPTIQSLAITYRIPKSSADVPPLVHTVVEKSRKRKRKAVDSQYPEQTSEFATGLPTHVNKLPDHSASAILPESTPGLTGDVYGLTHTDAPAVMDEIEGHMWLMDPYDDNTQPFVTIQISWKLRDQIILQRPKMM